MKKFLYHLGEYKITEHENGLLYWEKHFDFGMQRSGLCFILGDILIIGPWRHEESGFLIGEFLDQLKKLPTWNKTHYYCFVSELLDVNTGRRLTEELLKQMASMVDTDNTGANSNKGLKCGKFRLERYQITVNADGEVSWQTYGGMNRVIGGRCLIESDILFIGPTDSKEEELSKREFLDKLHLLSRWDSTIAWCRNLVLKPCRQQEQMGCPREFSPKQKELSTPDYIQTSIVTSQNRQAESPKKFLSSNFTSSKSSPPFFSFFTGLKFPKLLRFWPFGRKFWLIGLFLLVLSGLIIGLGIALHSLEEKVHRPHWFKERHHEDHSRSGSIVFTILLYSFFYIVFPFANTVRAEERDIILEESGIHYPGGFDPNTVGEVQGKILHFFRPERGPVRFQLSTDRGTYLVLTSPLWYWNDLQVRIPDGMEVNIRGSKSFGRDGNLYIIAQEVQIISSGQSFIFRGNDGTPLWKGSGWSGRGSSGGSGSAGGFGMEGGARGHGRR